MEYIFGYILAMSATGTAPSAEQVEEVVISLGVEVDQAKLRRIITRFHDQDIRHVINQGSKKIVSVTSIYKFFSNIICKTIFSTVKEDMLWTQSSSAALDGLLTIINNNETVSDIIRDIQLPTIMSHFINCRYLKKKMT